MIESVQEAVEYRPCTVQGEACLGPPGDSIGECMFLRTTLPSPPPARLDAGSQHYTCFFGDRGVRLYVHDGGRLVRDTVPYALVTDILDLGGALALLGDDFEMLTALPFQDAADRGNLAFMLALWEEATGRRLPGRGATPREGAARAAPPGLSARDIDPLQAYSTLTLFNEGVTVKLNLTGDPAGPSVMLERRPGEAAVTFTFEDAPARLVELVERRLAGGGGAAPAQPATPRWDLLGPETLAEAVEALALGVLVEREPVCARGLLLALPFRSDHVARYYGGRSFEDFSALRDATGERLTADDLAALERTRLRLLAGAAEAGARVLVASASSGALGITPHPLHRVAEAQPALVATFAAPTLEEALAGYDDLAACAPWSTVVRAELCRFATYPGAAELAAPRAAEVAAWVDGATPDDVVGEVYRALRDVFAGPSGYAAGRGFRESAPWLAKAPEGAGRPELRGLVRALVADLAGHALAEAASLRPYAPGSVPPLCSLRPAGRPGPGPRPTGFAPTHTVRLTLPSGVYGETDVCLVEDERGDGYAFGADEWGKAAARWRRRHGRWELLGPEAPRGSVLDVFTLRRP